MPIPHYKSLFPPGELERLNRELQIRSLQGTQTAGLQNKLRAMMVQAIQAQGERARFSGSLPTVATAMADFPTYRRRMEGKVAQADIQSILAGNGLLPRQDAGILSAQQPQEPQPSVTEVNQAFNQPPDKGDPEAFAQREALKARYFRRQRGWGYR